MRPPPYQVFRAELDMAEEGLQSFQDEVRTFINRHPQGLETKLNPKGNGLFELIVIVTIQEVPPPKLAILAGQVLQTTRSCLDHIVYELTLRGRPWRPPSEEELETCEFPIFNHQGPFSAKDKRGRPTKRSGLYKIRRVQPAAQAIIKSLQPYTAGANADLHPLWVLHELNNIHKHRHIAILGNPMGRIGVLADTFGPFELVSPFEEFATRPAKSRTIVTKGLIRELPGFQRKVRVHQEVPPHVAFDEVIAIPQKYAAEILEEILEFTRSEVLQPLEPFLL